MIQSKDQVWQTKSVFRMGIKIKIYFWTSVLEKLEGFN